jgi:uncharacterized membrane protein HdeD (DUF308 family)
MNNIEKVIKDNKLLLDIVNVILGIVIIILFVLVFFNPQNKYLFLAAFEVSGFMNIVNGLRQIKDNSKKHMGKFFLLSGIIIMAIGILLK